MPIDPNIALQVRAPQVQTDSPFETAGQMMKLRDLVQNGQLNAQKLEEQNLALEQARRDAQDQQTAQQILAKYAGNVREAMPDLSKSVGYRMFQTIQKADLAHREALAKIGKDELEGLKYKNDQLAGLTFQAKSLPADQYLQQWPTIAQRANAIHPELNLDPAKPVPQAALDGQMVGLLTEKHYLDSAAEARAADEAKRKADLHPWEMRTKIANAETAEQEAAGEKPIQPVEQARLDREMFSNPLTLGLWMSDPKRTPEEIGQARAALKIAEADARAKRPVTNVSVGKGQDAGVLTADDYERAGAEYAITGVMPPLGNGSAGVKQQLIHAKNEFARKSGLTPRDMALASAAFKGDSKSLASFQTQRDAIVSFEETAQKNLDQFLGLAKDLVDLNVPWVNTPLRLLDEKMFGRENIAAVNAARQVANNEIAKVTSGGGLGGVLSDSARHEVAEYNPKNATIKQTFAVAKVLKQDMANRHASMDHTLSVIRGRIGTFGDAPAAAATPVKTWNSKTQRFEE